MSQTAYDVFHTVAHTMRIDEIYETIVNANIYRLATEHVVRLGAILAMCIHLGVYLNEFHSFSPHSHVVRCYVHGKFWIAHSFYALELPGFSIVVFHRF